MQTPKALVSLADLQAAGIRLRAEEAVTLVRELIRQVISGEVVGVPSPHVIRLSAHGRISVEGPVAAAEPSVMRATQLLETLLQPDDGAASARVPGGLKLVLARGLRTLDLPPFGSLAEFAQALERFAAGDPATVVAGLVARTVAARCADPVQGESGPGHTEGAQVERFAPAVTVPVRQSAPPPALTISDIRRARRAAGVSLAHVAERSRIPVGLLRQLEWGYLLNWPAEPQGRGLLVRYARAAGLDEQLVVATVLPLIDQVASLRALFASGQGAAADRIAPARRAELAPERPVPVAGVRPAAPQARRGGRAWIAAAALLVASLPAAWFALSLDMPGRQPAAIPGAQLEQPETSGTERPAAAAEGRTSDVQRDANSVTAAGADRVEADRLDEEGPREPRAASAPATPPTTDPPVDRRPAVARPQSTAASRAETRVDGAVDAPGLAASVGAAMFYSPQAGDHLAVGTAGSRRAGSLLQVTRIVDDAANNSHVRPSPDGRYIAFDSDRHGERAVYVADSDGQNVQRVSPEGFAAMPSWSPDGRSLAFVRAEPGRADVWNLWTLERDTGALRQVTRLTDGQPQGGSWLPPGDRIVYSLADRLVIHDLRTGRERVFASPRAGRQVRSPVASPDGRRVVFQVLRDGTWLLDLTNGSMRRVLDDPTADEYAWSPDGTQLAYHSARSGGWGVWVMTSGQ